jgi:hypothetical protein
VAQFRMTLISKSLIVTALIVLILPTAGWTPSPDVLSISPRSYSQSPGAESHDPTNGWMIGATATAWQDFIRNGQYRWAGENDFRFPSWAQQRYRPDLERAANRPIQAGHIKGSYDSTEVALIVVDTTREDSNRYSVVIFSEKRLACEIKWLFQDMDLSRVQLGWSSGETLGISEYRDDGSRWHCFVKWNPTTGEYACDLKKAR